MPRPSFFRQQKLLNLKDVSSFQQSQSNLKTLNSISTSSNLKTLNNLSNASTNACISAISSKASLKRCSFQSIDIETINKNINYKTQVCTYWQSGVECPYNQNCRFAHGHTEKRNKKNQKVMFRTKICNYFFSTGACSYGARCQFLHKQNFHQRQRQYYRKILSQVHKDTEWFFINQKRMNVFKELENDANKQNTVTPPSSTSSISESSIKDKKSAQNSQFSLVDYKKKVPKARNCSIRL